MTEVTVKDKLRAMVKERLTGQPYLAHVVVPSRSV